MGKYLLCRYNSQIKNKTKNTVYSEFLIHVSDKIVEYYKRKHIYKVNKYTFSFQDVRILLLLKEILRHKININKIDQFIDLITKHVLENDGQDGINNLVIINIQFLLGLKINEKNDLINMRSTNTDQSAGQKIFLILNLYRLSKNPVYIKGLDKFIIEKINKMDKNTTTLLNLKKSMFILGLNKISGWGFILMSLKTRFKYLNWLDLYL